jgi:hypothetical protein
MPNYSQAELLIAEVEAFGAARPSSFGLGELQEALIQAITTFVAGTGTLTVPYTLHTAVESAGIASGLKIQFTGTDAGLGFSVFDHNGAPIMSVGPTGGPVVFGDRNSAAHGVFGPFMALDGTTSPPSILGPSVSYGAGGRIYIWPDTPANGWVTGTTKVNDLWYDTASGVWYQCTVSGAGTAAGTWVTNFGIGAQVAYNAVTTNCTNTTATGGTLASCDHTSGTSPTVTLPNDGGTYNLETQAPYFTSSTSADEVFIAIYDTTNSQVLAGTIWAGAGISTVGTGFPALKAGSVTGAGQVVKVYTCSATSTRTITIGAGSGGAGIASPFWLAATKVG